MKTNLQLDIRAKPLLFLIIIHCCHPANCNERGTVEQIGDVLRYTPFFAVAYSCYIEDCTGGKQLLTAAGLTVLTTEILKYAVDKKRPLQTSGKGQSFPSGHASFAFSGAAYLLRRYGYKIGIPAYLAASFTGYSRIYAKKHDWLDVLSGAAIGIGFNHLFTTPYKEKNYDVQLNVGKKAVALNFTIML